MTDQPPWEMLRAMRKSKLLKQADLARGIVSQSMLCQMERGRTIPSDDTIMRLAERLHVDPDPLLAGYARYRTRSMVREQLWRAFQERNIFTLERLLLAHGGLLTPFEFHAYHACVRATQSRLDEAEQSLLAMWTDYWRTSGDAADGTTRPGRRGEWTKVERSRVLVVEARVHELVATATQRWKAVSWWKNVEQERMQETNWPRERATANVADHALTVI